MRKMYSKKQIEGIAVEKVDSVLQTGEVPSLDQAIKNLAEDIIDEHINEDSQEQYGGLSDLVEAVVENSEKLEDKHFFFEQSNETATKEITIPTNITSVLKKNHIYKLTIYDADDALFEGLIAYNDGHYIGYSELSDYSGIQLETNSNLIVVQDGYQRTYFEVDITRVI